MLGDYQKLTEAINRAGFFISYRPGKGEAGVVLASKAYKSGPRAGGLSGNSFCVIFREEEWLIATWAPVYFRVTRVSQLAELCLRLLRRQPEEAYGAIDAEVQTEFGLEVFDNYL